MHVLIAGELTVVWIPSHRELAVLVTNPDCGSELWRVADEPCVEVVLASSGLAGRWVTTKLRPAPGASAAAAVDVVLEDVGDLACGLWSDRTEWLWIVLEHDLLAIVARYPLNEIRLDSDSIVGDGCIRIRHLEWRDVEDAEWQRWHCGDLSLDSEGVRHIDHVVQANELAEPKEAAVRRAQCVLGDGECSGATSAVVVACCVDRWFAAWVVKGAR